MSHQWMPMFWGDYMRKTGHLSTLEHGAYMLLICHYWSSGEPIPNDDNRLRIITRTTTKQWNEIKDTIKGYFEIRENKLYHQRISEELERTKSRSISQSSKALLRHKNEKKQQESPCRGKAAAMPTTPHIYKEDKSSSYITPEGVPDEVWKAYLAIRKKKKAADTAFAIGLVHTELRKLKEQGYSPQAVIEQSIRNSWIDVYPIREKKNATHIANNQKPASKTERLEAAVRRAAQAGGFAAGSGSQAANGGDANAGIPVPQDLWQGT